LPFVVAGEPASGRKRAQQAAAAPLIVLVTAPSLKIARGLAGKLVRQRCAACVNLLPGVQSLYRWEGAIHNDREVLLIAKTERRRLGSFKKLIAAHHPYEVPELVALSIEDGAASYLVWLHSAVGPVRRSS
jgi:periplasmic divalent cation tolerance protein